MVLEVYFEFEGTEVPDLRLAFGLVRNLFSEFFNLFVEFFVFTYPFMHAIVGFFGEDVLFQLAGSGMLEPQIKTIGVEVLRRDYATEGKSLPLYLLPLVISHLPKPSQIPSSKARGRILMESVDKSGTLLPQPKLRISPQGEAKKEM